MKHIETVYILGRGILPLFKRDPIFIIQWGPLLLKMINFCALNGIIITQFGDHNPPFLQYDCGFSPNTFLEATLEIQCTIYVCCRLIQYNSQFIPLFHLISNLSGASCCGLGVRHSTEFTRHMSTGNKHYVQKWQLNDTFFWPALYTMTLKDLCPMLKLSQTSKFHHHHAHCS